MAEERKSSMEERAVEFEEELANVKKLVERFFDLSRVQQQEVKNQVIVPDPVVTAKQVVCLNCDGEGEIEIVETCCECDGSGWVDE